MVKTKVKPFTLHTPVLTHQGMGLKPDLLLAVKDGHARIACLNELADLSKLISQVGQYLEILKDMRWQAEKRQQTQAKKR